MSLPEFDITGQKALVVGAGRGIGKGIALALAEAGVDVAIVGFTPTHVAKAAEEIRALGRAALPLNGDATKAVDMDEMAQKTLAEFGHVDILVTCVGDSIRKPVVQLPGSDTPGMTEHVELLNDHVFVLFPECTQIVRRIRPASGGDDHPIPRRILPGELISQPPVRTGD